MPELLPPDGTPWPEATAAVRLFLRSTFEELAGWCARDALDHRPEPGSWTGREVLEHVHLTDHYLFVLADKLADKSAARAARGMSWPARPATFSLFASAATVSWPHPQHMTPGGGVEGARLAADLRSDLARAEELLARFPDGQATLHTIRFSVVDARLDLVQLLAFAGLHGWRHLRQLERLAAAARGAGGGQPGDLEG